MTYTEFAGLVWRMRQAQKDYFLNRTRSALSEAKFLEKRVDEELLKHWIDVQQGNLFQEASGEQG